MMRRRLQSLVATLLGLTAAALLVSACDLASNCNAIGCPQDQICNEQTGECENPAIADCTTSESSCPDGEQCDPKTGLCRPIGIPCPERECPSDQRCNTRTGFCETVNECDAETKPCPSEAEVCDTVTNRCVPKPCEEDSECGNAHYCSDLGECRDGCRPQSANCPVGQFCRVADGQDIGRCADQCSSDSECPIAQRCEGFTCVTQSCLNDGDCRGEAVCKGEFCVPPPCTSDDDCTNGDVCDVATGQCLGGSCEDDDRAPNHVIAEASPVEPTTLFDRQICPGRPDWYEIDLRSADTLRVTVEQLDSDADLDVYIYAEDHELIGQSEQTDTQTRTTIISQREQTAFIEVRGPVRATSEYSISFEINPDMQCRDDPNEENDSRQDASDLSNDAGQLTRLEMTICGSDEDWFALRDLDATQGISLRLSARAQHIQTELLAPDGPQYVLSGDSGGQISQLDVRRLGVAGDYYIRVFSTQNRVADEVRLDVEVTEPVQCADAQAHSTPEDAFQQPPGPPPTDPASLCPLASGWEVDWVELEAPPTPASLYVQLTPSGGLPELNVDLFRRTNGGAVEPVRSAMESTTTEGGRIYEIRAPIDPSDAFFVRISADGAPGRIVEQVNYKLFYSFEPL